MGAAILEQQEQQEKVDYKESFPTTLKGLFRRHDFVSLTKSYMILSCMIFLFRRHNNVMCDFFQQ